MLGSLVLVVVVVVEHHIMQIAGLRQHEFKVCRQGFASIHRLGKKKMEVLMHKRKESPSVMPISDKRGHHPSTRAITGSRLQHVHEHIRALPVLTRHYSRAHSPLRQYLEAGGSITEFHSIYLVWMSERYPDEETVSESFYYTVFMRNYNIAFRAPLTDVCNICEKLETQISSLQKDGQTTSDLRNTLREHTAIAQVAMANHIEPGINAVVHYHQTITTPSAVVLSIIRRPHPGRRETPKAAEKRLSLPGRYTCLITLVP
ncbi:hypothetical protein Hamer_G006384 [Homarus americanus]|uniref:Uncharacterized protein n=1 Tax=Homarus americanus TaxID=6706 RepID=A0A8J5MPL4_HOMAM|nr:hypothetical protein Hamer_G006384 [Homarus americanus]